MQLDTPLSSSHPLWGQPGQRETQSQNAQPREHQRHSSIDQNSTLYYKGPNTNPSQASPQLGQLSGRLVESSPYAAPNGHRDGYKYPRDSRDVHFDAIERLQTQTSQNTSALAAQARTQTEAADLVAQIEGSLRREFQGQIQRQDQELRRMGESVNQLVSELAQAHATVMGLLRDMSVLQEDIKRRPSEAGQPAQASYQDDALELMARRIGDISHRTTDLETLRDHVAILGGKIHRIESESARQPHPQQYTAQPPPPTHPPQVVHAAPPPSHPAHAPSYQTPARTASIPQPGHPHEIPASVMPPESAQRRESAPGQNEWTPVNAGVKRVYEGAPGSHQDGGSAPGSPKRPRLVTGDSQDGHHAPPHPIGPPPHVLPSQAQPVVASQPPSTQPATYPGPPHEGYPAPHPAAQPGVPSSQPYPHYGAHGSPSTQNWHSEPRPTRGRGSRGGRGPGSRGGRVRKSMQGQRHTVGTPEWERDQWSVAPDSQASPGLHEGHSAHPGRSIVRRGGGGGSVSRVGSFPNEHQEQWTPEIGPRTVYHIQDSPIEVKKTRSKPIRNEDGILVRKDGRPDRRSQSSAANLRKVHARKEEQLQKETDRNSTPTRLHPRTPAGQDSASPPPHDQLDPNVTDSVRKKHHDILGRIFPEGIDNSRKQHDYAHQVFNEDRDHTAHPRAQVTRSAKVPTKIKKETIERSEIAETQNDADEDTEMRDAATSQSEHRHDDPQATSFGGAVQPTEQNRAQNVERLASAARTSRVQVPETQATADSATLATESEEGA